MPRADDRCRCRRPRARPRTAARTRRGRAAASLRRHCSRPGRFRAHSVAASASCVGNDAPVLRFDRRADRGDAGAGACICIASCATSRQTAQPSRAVPTGRLARGRARLTKQSSLPRGRRARSRRSTACSLALPDAARRRRTRRCTISVGRAAKATTARRKSGVRIGGRLKIRRSAAAVGADAVRLRRRGGADAQARVACAHGAAAAWRRGSATRRCASSSP